MLQLYLSPYWFSSIAVNEVEIASLEAHQPSFGSKGPVFPEDRALTTISGVTRTAAGKPDWEGADPVLVLRALATDRPYIVWVPVNPLYT